MRILAVDPGGTTGIARYDSAGGRDAFVSFELPTLPAIEAVHGVLRDGPVPHLVVCELFIIGTGTAKKTRAGSYAALDTIGAVKYLCHMYATEFEGHAPPERNFADNEKLRTLGWYNASTGGHRNDAARHLLVAAVKRGIIDPAMFLKEKE